MAILANGMGTRSRERFDDHVDLVRDRVLTLRAQAGDRAAFDELYLRYYQRLFRFCMRRLGDSHEAEDVTQEAFSRAWRHLPNFEGSRNFYPWLSVIAAHLCTDVFRRGNRVSVVSEFHQKDIASAEDGGEEHLLRAVDTDLVARAIEQLSERHRRVLRMREGSGWSIEKIADHEGVTKSAVETLLWRARQALKRKFIMLASAEGRSAVWIGSAVSLAALRRLLRLAGHTLRRTIGLGNVGAAVAVGSAALTAVVVASTFSSPASAPLSRSAVSTAPPESSGADLRPGSRSASVTAVPPTVASGPASGASDLGPSASAPSQAFVQIESTSAGSLAGGELGAALGSIGRLPPAIGDDEGVLGQVVRAPSVGTSTSGAETSGLLGSTSTDVPATVSSSGTDVDIGGSVSDTSEPISGSRGGLAGH